MKTNNTLNIFLLSRNPWFLDLLTFENNNNILILFDDVAINANINKWFKNIYIAKNVLSAKNQAICQQEIIELLTPILNEYPDHSIRIITYNENLVYLASLVRQHFSLDGLYPEKASFFTDKGKMREHFSTLGIAMPKYLLLKNNLTDEHLFEISSTQLGIPFVIKPTTLSGCRALAIINSFKEFQAYYSQYMANEKDLNFIAEEYIHGDLYHCDSLIDDKGKILTFVSKYNYPMHYFLEGKNVGSMILEPDSTEWMTLSRANEALLKKLDMPKGIYHSEFFMNSAGEVIFLEAAARPAGGFIQKMIMTAFEYNLLQSDLMPLNIDFLLSLKKYAAWLCVPFKGTERNVLPLYLLASEYEIFEGISDIKRCSTNFSEVNFFLFLQSQDPAKVHKDFSLLS